MSGLTNIEWADSTFNPWEGCTKVGPGCDHCYAENRNARFGGGTAPNWGQGAGRKRFSDDTWRNPIRWDNKTFIECDQCGYRGSDFTDIDLDCSACGGPHPWCPVCASPAGKPARRRVFCASLADWLDNEVPIEWLLDLLDMIRRTSNLDWLLLTKRIGIWKSRLELAAHVLRNDVSRGDDCDATLKWLHDWLHGTPPANVWIGATVVNQDEANRDIPKLLDVPACVRFLSVEPMLGPIMLGAQANICGENYQWNYLSVKPDGDAGESSIDWVICGGESGPKARPMHPDWVRSLRDQCQAADVPFLFKQWGEHAPDCDYYDDDDSIRDAALDGRETLITRQGHLWQVGTPGTDEHHDGQPPIGTWITHRVGKKTAGRQLDGRTWDEFPAPIKSANNQE